MKTFNQLTMDYPRACMQFASWMIQKFNVTTRMYDESVINHKYTIAARFFGYPLTPEMGIDGYYQMGEAIESMIEAYDHALKLNPKDPLKVLNQMEWQERNKYTEKVFTRRTRDGICNCLIVLPNKPFLALSDTLIPFKGRSSIFGQTVSTGEPIMDNYDEQFWLDSIQWSWDVKAGKILIPF